MAIEIKNCNNIDIGNISIEENRLNIKYAINGTGKSTITKAIEKSVGDTDDLQDLMPFISGNSCMPLYVYHGRTALKDNTVL